MLASQPASQPPTCRLSQLDRTTRSSKTSHNHLPGRLSALQQGGEKLGGGDEAGCVSTTPASLRRQSSPGPGSALVLAQQRPEQPGRAGAALSPGRALALQRWRREPRAWALLPVRAPAGPGP